MFGNSFHRMRVCRFSSKQKRSGTPLSRWPARLTVRHDGKEVSRHFKNTSHGYECAISTTVCVVAGRSRLRQSKSLILSAPHGRKKICDYPLQRDSLRKYKLHPGSESDEYVGGGDSYTVHFARSAQWSCLALARYESLSQHYFRS